MKAYEEYLAKVGIGDTYGQAASWLMIYDLCKELGFYRQDGTALENVLTFIKDRNPISKRECFAGKALQIVAIDLFVRKEKAPSEELARRAYIIADAMIAEGKKS